MLLTVEAGIFPFLCGWWMDICSFVTLAQQLSVSQTIFTHHLLLILLLLFLQTFWQALFGSNFLTGKRASLIHQVSCLLLAAWLFNLHVLYHSLSLPPSLTGTVMFLHWLSGMVFIFYFALIIVLLHEILHPRVLWFLRNLNDNNFHPIQDVSGLSGYMYMYMCTSAVLVLLVLLVYVWWSTDDCTAI